MMNTETANEPGRRREPYLVDYIFAAVALLILAFAVGTFVIAVRGVNGRFELLAIPFWGWFFWMLIRGSWRRTVWGRKT